MKEEIFINLIIGLIIVTIVLTPFLFIFISPIYEKEHYTKLTGIEVSYFDALFIDLDASKHIIQIDEKNNKFINKKEK